MHAERACYVSILNASPTNEPGKAVGRCRHTLTRRMPKLYSNRRYEELRHIVSLYS
jgi:hypothetical protein